MIALLIGNLFLTACFAATNDYYVYNKWQFVPFCFIFLMMTVSTMVFVKVKQSIREIVGVVLISIGLFMFVLVFPTLLN